MYKPTLCVHNPQWCFTECILLFNSMWSCPQTCYLHMHAHYAVENVLSIFREDSWYVSLEFKIKEFKEQRWFVSSLKSYPWSLPSCLASLEEWKRTKEEACTWFVEDWKLSPTSKWHKLKASGERPSILPPYCCRQPQLMDVTFTVCFVHIGGRESICRGTQGTMCR